MKFLENYKEKLKKKPWWSRLIDILFVLLVIGLLIPSTRTPIIVFIKKATMFSPSVSADENYGQLTKKDYQWQLRDDDGIVKSLNEFQDKPIFINFWATWCPPCIAEMPAIESLQEEYGDRVHFLLVTYEDHSLTKKFLSDKSLFLSTYQAISKEPEILSSKSIPTTFIVDNKGQIVVREVGSSNWNSDSVKELLDELIK